VIVTHKNISFYNVVSKKYRLYPDDMEIAMKDFTQLLSDNGMESKGPFFFTIESPLEREIYEMTFYMPVNKLVLDGREKFEYEVQSYFSVKNLLLTRVLGDFNNQSQLKYVELLNFVREQNLDVITPFFNVVREFQNFKYVDIMLGVDNI
jgi:Domain of unknown function (DUF5085)